MSTFNLSKPIKIVNPVSNVDSAYGPYATIEEATGSVDILVRGRGKTVAITGSGYLVEYWWKDGITDSDLVVKQPSGEIFSGSFSGSFQGDGSGLTGVAPAAGDGIFVTGTTVSVDSASLATDMAGDFITATNGTLNLNTSIGTLGTTEFTGSYTGSFTGDGSGLTGVISSDATKAQTVETISTTSNDEHFLTFVDSNNSTAAAEIVYTTSGIIITPETNAITAGIVSSDSFSGSFSGSFEGDGSGLTGVTAEWDGSHIGDASITGSLIISGANASVDFTNAEAGVSGSFSGSFEGDGSGLTGVAPIAGDGIFVTGTTVSVDSGSLIQTATNDSAYNVLFSNSTTPFAKDNPTSHFSYNPGTNELRVSGSIELGSDDGSEYSPEIRFKVNTSAPSGRMVVFEKQNGTEFASIEIDNNHNLVNVLDSDGKRNPEQSFTWKSSGSAAAGLVTRMELTGDSGDLTVYGSISGSSLETSGQVTIGTVNTADATVETALVIDGSGNVQSRDLGNSAFQDTGSMTVAEADTATTADQASKVETQDTNSTNTHYLTFVDSNNNPATGELVYTAEGILVDPGNAAIAATSVTASFKGDLAGTATTASYVETAQSASHVAAAFDTVSATNATITLTDMGGNTSSVTVNNVSNATTAVNATNATNATNINVDQASDDTAYNITFTESTTGNASLLVDDNGKLTFNPNTNTLAVGSTLTVGGAATVGTNLTVGGDLTVNGTTTTLNTTNLEVEDSFILLSSGSSATGDSGIIFGGSSGTAGQGNALVWDASYKVNQGRLGVTGPITSGTSSPISDEDLQYYIAGVYVGTESEAADNNAAHNGNIRIDGNDIYIYVE